MRIVVEENGANFGRRLPILRIILASPFQGLKGTELPRHNLAQIDDRLRDVEAGQLATVEHVTQDHVRSAPLPIDCRP